MTSHTGGQVGCLGVERDVADLVDHNEPVTGDLAQLGFQAADAVGEAADHRVVGGETDPVPGLSGGDRQRGRQALAGAWRTETTTLRASASQPPGVHRADLGAVESGLGAKSKSVIVLIAGNPAYRMRSQRGHWIPPPTPRPDSC